MRTPTYPAWRVIALAVILAGAVMIFTGAEEVMAFALIATGIAIIVILEAAGHHRIHLR